MIDFDAHKGQTDAADAARFIVQTHFPGAYSEPSPRGYHLHPLIRIGWIRRTDFNELLRQLEHHLGMLLKQQGFASIVEVKGTYTELTLDRKVYRRGLLAAVPRLPGGEVDLERLIASPVFTTARFAQIREDAESLNSERQEKRHNVCVSWNSESRSRNGPLDPTSAWERMRWACLEFIHSRGRLPSDEAELCAYYKVLYRTDDGNRGRVRRAKQVLQYAAQTFDPARAGEGGYERYRGELLAAVRTYCVDRTTKYMAEITEEDLAVGLFLVQRNSFAVQDDARLQWTVPVNAFPGIFAALCSAKLINRRCNRNKAIALKGILQRAGLIECIDNKYKPAGGYGIGKKYTIGHNHWRFAEFVRFSQGLHVEYVSKVRPVPGGTRHTRPLISDIHCNEHETEIHLP